MKRIPFPFLILLLTSSSLMFPAIFHGVAQARDGGSVESIGEKAPLPASQKPKEFEGVGIEEKLGQNVDLNLTFKDENGETVQLGKYFTGHKPVALSLVYFNCPGLCNFHLNGVVDTLKTIDWTVGKEFEYVVISFDSKEAPDVALPKKANYMKEYGKPGSESGWHFLTGDAETIKKITEQVGFKYKWNEESKEWAHASAATVLSSKGQISRYLHGIAIEGRAFKLALSEASENKIGTFVDQLIWFCFHYDPKQSKYVIYAFRLVQAGGIAILILLAFILGPYWIRRRAA